MSEEKKSVYRRLRTPLRWLIGVLAVLLLVLVPRLGINIPGVLPGPTNTPGALQILAVGLVYAGLAMTFDLVFGYTGYVPFGHAIWFGFGAYFTALLVERANIPYAFAVLLVVVMALIVAGIIGAIAFRLRGIAFAMVTLAFAQAFYVVVTYNITGIFGGDEGIPFIGDPVPPVFRGVLNTSSTYFLALSFAVVVWLIGRQVVRSQAGHVWVAIRENEDRVRLLGLNPLPFKLLAYVLSAGLATIGGAVFLVVARGVDPSVTSANFSLLLLVMVVVGGAGRLWGAAIGGFLFGVADFRLSALGSTGSFAGLPSWISGPLSQPEFLLGAIFVIVMLLIPGGIASVLERPFKRRDSSSSATPSVLRLLNRRSTRSGASSEKKSGSSV